MAKIVPDARAPAAGQQEVRVCRGYRELKTLGLKGKQRAVKLRAGQLAAPRFSSLSGRLDV
jgi:hypothetical protein